MIPVFVVETGVFGCPVELTLESRPDEAMTYEYDASGHMVRADRERFAWDGDVLRSSNRGSGDIPIGIEGRRVWMGDAQSPEREAILDERGRPTRIRRFANGSLFSEATQTYDGERLAGVRIRFSPNGGGSDVVATPCD